MREIPLRQLAKSLTVKRLWNLSLAVSSFLLSWATRKSVVWGTPPVLTIEPTNFCNLKCPLCVTGNGRMERPAGFMSFDAFRKTVDQIGDRVCYLLLYHQGEPFINRDFLKFVEYAKSRRIFVTTSTNAHYFSPEIAQATVASGLDSIIVSVDGIDQHSYETYRVNGNFARVNEGVRNLVLEKERLRSKTPVIYLQFILMQHNEHQVAQMEALASDWGADKFLKKTVQVETVAEARRWLPKRGSNRRYVADSEQLRPKRLVTTPCPRPWTSSLVNWDGSVVPCCFDKNGRHKFGTVFDKNDFPRIWESEDYENFRAKMLTARSELDICSNCSQGIRLFI